MGTVGLDPFRALALPWAYTQGTRRCIKSRSLKTQSSAQKVKDVGVNGRRF